MTLPSDPTAGLDALVSGKRRVPRRPVRLPVVVKGVRGAFEGSVRDLSMDGALVCVPVAELGDAAAAPLGPAEQFELLERHFRDSFDLVFVGTGVVAEAQVVRLLVSSEDIPDAELALGCRFVQALTETQQRKLGLLEEGRAGVSWGRATLEHELRWAADPARPVTALLLDERSALAGPLHVGPVCAVARRALSVRLPGTSCEALQEQLGEGSVQIRLVRGARRLLEGPATLAAVRYADAPLPGCELLLVTERPLPRAVRKHFQRV